MSKTLNIFFFFFLSLQVFYKLFIIWGNSLTEGGYSCTSVPHSFGCRGLFLFRKDRIVQSKLISLSVGFCVGSYARVFIRLVIADIPVHSCAYPCLWKHEDVFTLCLGLCT